MGKIIDWNDEFHKREKELDKEHDRRFKRPNKVRTSVYLGYGYYILHYEDGTQELKFDPKMTGRFPLGSALKVDDRGFPIFE